MLFWRTIRDDKVFEVALRKLEILTHSKFSERDKDTATLEILISIHERLDLIEERLNKLDKQGQQLKKDESSLLNNF